MGSIISLPSTMQDQRVQAQSQASHLGAHRGEGGTHERGAGVGSRLVHELVTDGSSSATELYARAGFEFTGERGRMPHGPASGMERMRVSLGIDRQEGPWHCEWTASGGTQSGRRAPGGLSGPAIGGRSAQLGGRRNLSRG